jgi:DNA primase
LKADLSPPQIILLAKKRPKVIIPMFDGDRAGYAANEKVEGRLKANWGDFISPANLPFGKDPKNLESKDLHEIIRRCVKRTCKGSIQS